MNYCETCKRYVHKPSIIGGVAYCAIGEKKLLTFWKNEACDKYIPTKGDKFAAQNKCYEENLIPLKMEV